MNRILLFFCLLFGLYSCHTPSTTKTPPANIVSEFRITSTQVGAIRKGMTIKELYAALPEDRIKKLKTRTELSNETADYYYIYGDSSRLLLIVNTERQNDERSRISRIIVKDKRFQTAAVTAVTEFAVRVDTGMPDLRAARPPAVQEAVVGDDPDAHALRGEKIDEIADIFSLAVHLLRQRAGVAVFLDIGGDLEFIFEVAAYVEIIDPEKIGRVDDQPVFGVHGPRRHHADPENVVGLVAYDVFQFRFDLMQKRLQIFAAEFDFLLDDDIQFHVHARNA